MMGAERLILIGYLLQGALCRDFSISMPPRIEALSESCVLIPCTFDIQAQYDNELTDPTYGKWYKGSSDKDNNIVFDSSRTGTSSTLNRIQGNITGNLLQKNCTTILYNIPLDFNDTFYFRLHSTGRLRWNFVDHSVHIQVTDSPPKPTLSPEQVRVAEGTSVSLTCSAAAPCPTLPPTLTWSTRLSDSEENLQENPDKTKSMSSVLNFTASPVHNGQISCTATYEQNTTNKKITKKKLTITVLYPPKNTSVSVSPSGPVLEGSPVALTCSSNANPPVKGNNYTWYRVNGREKVAVGSGQNLTFNVTDPKDSGQYLCTAQNEHGKANSSTVQLDIQYPPKNTSVSVSPSGPVLEGSPVALTCSSNANPPVKGNNYTWYRVNGSEKVAVGSGQNLTFNVTDPKDSGQYLCTAQNEHGKANSSTVQLDIQYPPKNTSVSVSPSGPVLEGSPVALTCSSNANPPVKGNNYTWYRVNGSEKVAVGSGQNLTFNVTDPKDSGQYLCTAQNEHGKANSSTVQLDIQYPPKNTSVSASPSGPALEGRSVTLTCGANANPPVKNFTWYSVDGGQVTQTGLGVKLIIQTSNRDNPQFYCEASNDHGTKNSSLYQLDVLYSPQNTSVSVSPRGYVLKGSSLTLTCSSDANPPVKTYSWYRVNGSEMDSVGFGQNLTFNATNPEDSGQYYCKAQNEHGIQNSTSIDVDIQFAPQISPSSSCSRSEGQISCSCESRGNPFPKLEWLLSGRPVNPERVIREEPMGNTSLRISLTMRISPGDTPTLLCISTNALGSASLQLLMPFNSQEILKGHERLFLLIGAAAAGAAAMMLLCSITHLITRRKQGRQSCNGGQGDTAGLILTEGTAFQEGDSLYSNQAVLSEHRRSNGNGDARGDPDSLHYATVDFSKLKGKGAKTGTGEARGSSSRTSDYAEVRHRATGQASGEAAEGETGGDEGSRAADQVTGDPEPQEASEEGQTEQRAEVKKAEEVMSPAGEDATYGNICRTKRASELKRDAGRAEEHMTTTRAAPEKETAEDQSSSRADVDYPDQAVAEFKEESEYDTVKFP